jgi:sugar O-acyltransferase (sialic acid O-acetyltransferase NeuD family)
MRPLHIIGAGGFGREVLAWLRQSQDWGRDWQFAGFVDDNPQALAGRNCPEAIVSSLAGFIPDSEGLLVCAIGDPATRLRICRELQQRGARFHKLIHPSVTVGEGCVVGAGCILCPGVILTVNVRLGDFVIVNVQSSIGHDAVIGDGVTLSGHVDITGNVVVGEGAFFGTHAAIMPGARVGAHAKVGAGTVVLRTVKLGATVMGVPAKQILP